MSKNYKENFKIVTSENTPNKYIILRRTSSNFQEVAYAKVVNQGQSYILEASVHIPYDELQYLSKQLRKIIGIGDQNIQSDTFY